VHNALTRAKAQTVAYADTQKHSPQFIATQTPKNTTHQRKQTSTPNTNTKKHHHQDTENPHLLNQHKEQTGLIPINKESKIYYGTHKPRQRWDTTTTPSNTPQTRAPSPTKTPDQGLPNNYSPKMDKNKNAKNRCPTTIPQKKNKEKEHHPAHGNHRTHTLYHLAPLPAL
jgi:hypothetical protein